MSPDRQIQTTDSCKARNTSERKVEIGRPEDESVEMRESAEDGEEECHMGNLDEIMETGASDRPVVFSP